MIDRLLSTLAPHYCCGCDKIGTLLCPNCKYYITSESYEQCLSCGNITANQRGICNQCQVPYSQAWCVGERQGELQRLIGTYKFQRAKAAYTVLAELIDHRVPILPPNTVIIPLPTVPSHIRQRGYDHTLLIAQSFAHKRHLEVSTALQRSTSTKQRDANRSQRIAQAKTAFSCGVKLDPDVPYLLIDDIVTTGASIKYAAKALCAAGAKDVWVVCLARQTLD